ncbi:protein DDC8 homolog [Pipistrellus kuhlii]|uniref:protein DDC8 homolog n=1 Tax=Pipistrellus kuhlii TaxID=59472 RepID=UPI001E27064E|nr:protein DDC8 homolog [Pipistrellus kuhlii]
MAAKTPHVKRGAERAAHQSPHPDDQALLLRPNHKLLPVRERGRPAVQRRPDPGPWRSPPPQHWAAAQWPGRQDGRQQRARGPDRPHPAHPPGPGRCWPAGARPEPQGPPARRGAAGRPRAREKQRAAGRGEKRRQEDLVRLRPRPLKSRKTAAGDEEKGAGRAGGLPRLAPGPPERSKGKRGPSKTCSGSRRPEPRAPGDLDVGALWAAAGGMLLGDREEDGAPAGMRVPARSARLPPGPWGQEDELEPRWPGGGAWGRAASPPPSPRPRREGSRWKRELESVFRELFSTNRKLKTHLNRYLESQSGTDTCPSEKRAADPLTELGLGPAAPAARPAAPSANLKELLRQLKDRQYLRMVEPLFADAGGLAPHPEEEALPWCSLPPLHEPPRPDPLLPQLPPQALAGRAGPAAWPRQSPEQRWRPQLVEVHEVPQLSWEALGTPLGAPGEETEMTETEPELRALTRPHPAHLPGCTPLRLEEPRGCARGTPAPAPSPPAASSEEEEEDDDRGHSQMIRDLQEQILEQSKSHKQFLDQARRRLKEFQSEC